VSGEKNKDWHTLFQLLDRYFDVDPAERDSWLEQLEESQRSELRRLLAQRENSGSVAFLDRPLNPHVLAGVPQIGAVIRGRFRLVEELGRGGMGIVFKAVDLLRVEAQDRQPYVAIKLLNADFKAHPHAFTALQREAKRANTLLHPNVIHVYDFDRDGEWVYLTMEYLQGRPLDDLMQSEFRGGLPLERAWPVIRAVGSALQYGHGRGIIHCDLKPSNVFLCDDGVVKVLDFGVARRVPVADHDTLSTLFDPRVRIGAVTSAFASLELLSGMPADPRDDVYSLSCLTYELICGMHPFQLYDARHALESGITPQRLSSLSRTQWRTLQQGLALHRDQRCASIARLLHGLQPRATLGSSAVSLWKRLRKSHGPI